MGSLLRNFMLERWDKSPEKVIILSRQILQQVGLFFCMPQTKSQHNQRAVRSFFFPFFFSASVPFPFISVAHRNYCASLSSAEYTSNRRWSTGNLHRGSQAARGRASCMLHCFINLFFLLFGKKVNRGDPEQIEKCVCVAGWEGAWEACDGCGSAASVAGLKACGAAVRLLLKGPGGLLGPPQARMSCCRLRLSCGYCRDAGPAHTWQDLPLPL